MPARPRVAGQAWAARVALVFATVVSVAAALLLAAAGDGTDPAAASSGVLRALAPGPPSAGPSEPGTVLTPVSSPSRRPLRRGHASCRRSGQTVRRTAAVRVMRIRRGQRTAYYACSLRRSRAYLLGVAFAPGARGTRHGDRANVGVFGVAGTYVVWSEFVTDRTHGRYRHSLHLADLTRGRDAVLSAYHAAYAVTFRTSDRAMTRGGAVAFNASDEEKATFFNIVLFDGRKVRVVAGNAGRGVSDLRLHASVGPSAYTVSWSQGGQRHQVVVGP